jgi:hypothetical protein
MRAYLDYISGVNLQKCADYVIDFDHLSLDPKVLTQDAIIFCKTDFLDDLFRFLQFSTHKYILCSHMSDYPIDFNRFSKKPLCIKKWFAQNAVFSHHDLISIPLGLENQSGKSKGKFTNHDWFVSSIDTLQHQDKDKTTVYCNWRKNTNLDSRSHIVEQLQVPYVWEEDLSFETYCEHSSNYKFVICPPGNGADSHRVWETLYMNGIPIVLKNSIYKNYKLPIVQVNSWSEVTPELLKRYENVESCNEIQLSNGYWCNEIKKSFLER